MTEMRAHPQAFLSGCVQPEIEAVLRPGYLLFCITLLMGCGQQATQPKTPRPPPTGGEFEVVKAAFSPDNKLLMTLHELHSGARRPPHLDHLKLWDVGTGKELRSFKGRKVSSFAFLPDGKTMLWGGLDKPLRVWDVINDKEIRTFSSTFGEEALRVNCLAMSPDGRLAVTGGGQEVGSVNVWDVASGELKRTLQWRHGVVYRVTMSPDGKLALAAMSPTLGHDETVQLWEAASGKLIKSFARSEGWGAPFAFLADGKFILLGRSDHTALRKDRLVLWDLARDKEIWRIPEPSSFVIMPDGKSLLAAHPDGKVRRW